MAPRNADSAEPAAPVDPTTATEATMAPTWADPTSDELAALDALGAKGTWELQGRELALTNLDKVLFPGRDDAEPLTKRDLVRHHARIAPRLLPYLHDRAVNLHRFPNGVEKAGFWHKAVPSHAPEWITRWHFDEAKPDDTQWYFVADQVATLAWLANYGAVELHPWTSAASAPRRPTWALIDIDPGTRTTFEEAVVLARLYRVALDHLGVEAQPKVTGQRVEKVSRAVGQMVPELVSWKWHTSERDGLARLDYTQNAINKTLVAPFSARPAPGAPVSVPIGWDELDDPDLAPDRWTIRTVLDRLAAVGDPMARLIGLPQELPEL
jgi:bifunctional non-homologous end joining protein LigD